MSDADRIQSLEVQVQTLGEQLVVAHLQLMYLYEQLHEIHGEPGYCSLFSNEDFQEWAIENGYAEEEPW